MVFDMGLGKTENNVSNDLNLRSNYVDAVNLFLLGSPVSPSQNSEVKEPNPDL